MIQKTPYQVPKLQEFPRFNIVAAISVGGRGDGATSSKDGTTTFSPLDNDPEDTIPSPETAEVSSF